MLNETAGSYWAYWTSPDTITAYSTLLLVIVTGILALVTWMYVREVKSQEVIINQQAGSMETQSKIMLENAEYDRLSRRLERLNKEMALLVGPLYVRRNETGIFKMVDRSERYSYHVKDVLNAMHYDYITFWEAIDLHLYLNQSSELRRALNNYSQAISNNFYFIEQNNQQEVDRNKEIFQNKTVPFLIKKIEERYDQLDKDIKDLEDRLNIRKKA